MSLELFVLPSSGGLYPRRVLIYLSEKGLLSLPSLTITPVSGFAHTAPGKLPGSVPQLRITSPSGEVSHLMESIPIIEYLEDLCESDSSPFIPTRNGEEDEHVWKKRKRSMRGDTSMQRERTKKITALADEATTHFSDACRSGSAMFALIAPLSNGNYAATQEALSACHETLVQINDLYSSSDSRFAYADSEEASPNGTELDNQVLISDCVLFALLQFSIYLYGLDLAEGLPSLQRFYTAMEKRSSTAVEEATFPPELKVLAGRWVKESHGIGGRVVEGARVAGTYGVVLGMAGKGLVRGLFVRGR